MSRRTIAATALAAGMSVVLFGCSGGPAKTVAGSAPVAGSAEGAPKGAAAGSAGHRAGPVTMGDARGCRVALGHPAPRTAWWRGQRVRARRGRATRARSVAGRGPDGAGGGGHGH